jgi:translation elongation factor EF-1beta
MQDDTQAIRESIEATRERIADTAEALAYKTDVQARVRENVAFGVESLKATAAVVADDVSATLVEVAETTRDGVTAFAERVSDGAADLAASASEIAASAADRAADAADSATRFRLRDVREFIERRPLEAALGSIAAGFVVGLALPVSGVERARLGPAGKRLRDGAATRASDIAARALATNGSRSARD